MSVTPINKLLPTNTELLQDARQVRVICSTSTPDRMGDIIVQDGFDLEAYRKNPVVLWMHNANMPVAKATEIGVEGGRLKATVQFPAEGVDAESDRVYSKIKAGIVNATSVGFAPMEYEPIDQKQPWNGLKFTKSELLEFSFVSVPANKEALIVGRSLYAVADEEKIEPVIEPDIEPDTVSIPRQQFDAIMAVPEKFRGIAKSIPSTVKGARGNFLRAANIVEEALKIGVDEPPAEAPPPAEVEVEVVQDKFAATAAMRLRLLKHKLAE